MLLEKMREEKRVREKKKEKEREREKKERERERGAIEEQLTFNTSAG